MESNISELLRNNQNLDDYDLYYEIIEALDEKYNNSSPLTEAELIVFLSHDLLTTVEGASFNEFLEHAGSSLPQTLKALKTVGADDVFDLLTKALAPFRDIDLSNAYLVSETWIKLLDSEAPPKIWWDFDEAFVPLADSLRELNLKFIRENRESFLA